MVIKTLREHQIACGNPFPDILVFPSNNGALMDGRNLYQREFMAALRRAGLRKVRFHDLRHSYASILISQGENNKFIQQQLGHASITTTMDTYGHLLKSPEEERKAASRLADTIFGRKLSTAMIE